MTKHFLNTQDDFDFLVIGIVCPENQYILVNKINHVLNIDLRLDNYIDLSHRLGKDFKFSMFNYLDEEFNLEYNFLPNRSNYSANEKTGANTGNLFSLMNENIDESSRLIPELTKTDYFLLIKGDEYNHFIYKITEGLKQIPEIISIQEIIPDKLNSKNNLIF